MRKKEISTVQYLRARERLDRDWAYFLSAKEVRVLSWLMSMTLGWRNAGGDYSLRQMLNGIPNTDVPGEWWTRGIGLSHYTIRKALKSLKQKGVLSVGWGAYGKRRYAVNLNWSPAADGTRVAVDEPAAPAAITPNESANTEQGPSNGLAPAEQNISDLGAKAKQPYKTDNTSQKELARHKSRSLRSGGSREEKTEKELQEDRLNKTLQDVTYISHFTEIPVLSLPEKEMEKLLGLLNDEEERLYKASVDSEGHREAMLQLSNMVGARAEWTKQFEEMPYKAKRLFQLADLLRGFAGLL